MRNRVNTYSTLNKLYETEIKIISHSKIGICPSIGVTKKLNDRVNPFTNNSHNLRVYNILILISIYR